MKLSLLAGFLFIILQISCIDARRKISSSSLRRGSSNSRYASKSTSRPSTGGVSKTGSGNSAPSYGWNVPKQQTPAKASAPVNEHASKTSATNVQSSNNNNWKPSGGYNTQTGQPYGQSGYGNSYNPSANQHNSYPNSNPYGPSHMSGNVGGYNSYPSYSQPNYNAPGGFGGHNPGYSPSYHQPAYNQYSSHSYAPGPAYNPPVGYAKSPGIGQLVKEAVVFAGVSAGVNAVASRIIPGGIYGHSSSGGSSGSSSGNAANVPSVTHTQITYNNYYNNGTSANPAEPAAVAAPGAPPAPATPTQTRSAEPSPVVPIDGSSNANQQTNPPAAPANANNAKTEAKPANDDANFPSPTGLIISKGDILQLTNELFAKDTNNANKYITINLQGHKTDDSTSDDAPESLLTVKDEAYEIPTVKAVLALHDNYEFDVKVKETVTPEERREENDLIDVIANTEVMKTTMKFLAEKGYVPNDEYEFKDMLKRVWFSQFKRIDNDPGSSGFETTFLAEKFDNEIIGLHNWIYYAKQEANKKLNYLGYIKQTSLSDKGAIVKLRSSLNDIIQPVTAIFVGTSPELEIALYTMCFYTRPNYPCPIKLGDQEFIIIANRVNYFGKDILVAAYPEI